MQEQSGNRLISYILVEDFNGARDNKFTSEYLEPYLRDLFKDLLLRCISPVAIEKKKIDKVTFLEYCSLPGIVGDRFLKVFEPDQNELISEESFVSTLAKVFISSLESKMQLTFNMYDFNNDGKISNEDVRIVLSYIPFQRKQEEEEKLTLKFEKSNLNFDQQVKKNQEGLYQQEDGKNLKYHERIMDQEEIKGFLSKVFNSKSLLSLQDYLKFNKEISSEMFLSIITIIYQKLPCAQQFFRLKKIYKTRMTKSIGIEKCRSPASSIASPSMLKNIAGISKLPLTPGNRDPSTPIIQGQARILSNQGSPKFRKSSGTPSSYILSQHTGSNEEEKGDTFGHAAAQLTQSKFKQQSQVSEFGDSLTIPLKQVNQQMINLHVPKRKDSGTTPSSGMKNAVRMDIHQKNSKILRNESASKSKGTTPQHKSKFAPAKKGSSSNFSQLALNAGYQYEQIQSPQDSDDEQSTKEEQVLENYGVQENKAGSIFHESECYLKTKSDKYSRHWVVLMGNELYCYRRKEDTTHRIMHSLVGTFIKDLPSEMYQELMLYPVKIVLPPNKSRILFFTEKEQQQNWFNMLKDTVGYSNIFDFYNLDKTLGEGQFGQVKLATHKKTGQKVAIKIIKKKAMKSIEIYQQRREIEVLKMSQHPNIIKLIDLFENSDYYYIVLEYMAGNDLFDYMKYRKFKITEDRARFLTYQIAQGLEYLHQYGIVHRDVKLENVMMSDNSDQAIPKLADFGLAKIIGPSEKSDEPFGTIGYVAPEVLKKDPYSFSCDLWGLGCIAYALLSGSLPFDCETQQETVQMTLYSALVFDLPCWKSHSNESKDLITKLLIKDPDQRIKLEQVLQHPWFAKYSKSRKNTL